MNRKNKVVLFSDVRASENRDFEIYMPLSIMTIGTILESNGFQVKLIDGQVEECWQKILTAELKDALFMGVSSLTGPSIIPVLQAINLSKKVAPNLPVVWGGYHATLSYNTIIRERISDFVVRGAGELPILELTLLLRKVETPTLEQLRKIKSLVFMNGSEIVKTRPMDLPNMNDLPPLNYNLIDVTKYYGKERKSLEYISSYGCVHRCAFCVEPGHTVTQTANT